MKTLALTLCAMLALISVAQARPVCRDRDNNPPGWRGGRGTNWENPPGRRGGPGFGTRWGDNDNNPPGRLGGRGSNWERRDRRRCGTPPRRLRNCR